MSAVTLGALSVGTVGVPVEATGKSRVVKPSFTYANSPTVVTGSPSCDPAGNCVVSYTISSQDSGDLRGTASDYGIAYTKAGSSTFQFTAVSMLTGSARGCGSGSFATYFPLTMAGSEPLSARDMMVPGSGSGDLAGMSAVGPQTYTYDPASRTGTGSGLVRCQVG